MQVSSLPNMVIKDEIGEQVTCLRRVLSLVLLSNSNENRH